MVDAKRSGQAPLQILAAERAYTPDEITGPVSIIIEGPLIWDVWQDTDVRSARARLAAARPGIPCSITELGALRLTPGYIDLHLHGFSGYDVNTATVADLHALARLLPRTGTTAFYPTIATTSPAQTLACVRTVVAAAEVSSLEAVPGATIAGIRLEGPFISAVKKGAQDPEAIRAPDVAELERLVDAGRGLVRFVDFAPEVDRDGRLFAAIRRLGLIGCIGHTNATYEQTIQAIDQGARHSTHLFNAMSSLGHRAPGAPGALLTDRRATVEVIADGVHLAPALLQLALRMRGARDVALVTDAMLAAGLPDGDYHFLNRLVHVRARVAKLESGALAGSTLTLDKAVRNMVAFTGVPWADAITMATLTPARIAGIDARKGRLAPGYDADLVAIDAQGHVHRSWTRGQLAYIADTTDRLRTGATTSIGS